MDSTLLEKGKLYIYKGKELTYKYRIPDFFPKFIFLNEKSKEVILTQKKVNQEISEAITTPPRVSDCFNSTKHTQEVAI